MNMLNESKSKKINTIIFLLFLVIGFASLAAGTVTLNTVPENISMWTNSSSYPYEFNLDDFGFALDDATAVGVIEGVSVKGNISSTPDVDIVLIDSHYNDLYTPKMEYGKFFWEEDYGRMAAVINKSLAFQLFGYTDCVGEELTYMEHMYTIIGVCSDSYTIYTAEDYVLYIPYSPTIKYTTSYIGVAAVPIKTKAITAQALNRLMAETYTNYETVDTISSKQTIWFGLKLSTIPLLAIVFFLLGRYIKRKAEKRINKFKNKLKNQYLLSLIPEIIIWALIYALIFFIIFYILKLMYDQLLYGLASLGESYRITAVDSKNLAYLFSSIQSMADKQVKLSELVRIKESRNMLSISVICFYLFWLFGFATGIFKTIIVSITDNLRRQGDKIYHITALRRKKSEVK
jgi:hypothetical protein